MQAGHGRQGDINAPVIRPRLLVGFYRGEMATGIKAEAYIVTPPLGQESLPGKNGLDLYR
ncbi:hypothetical protein AA15973_1142 [Komagataeibacter sucrofermentans DSM 15973]|nr:hypothetical protein AA15973_1142 [Komagataeibacter sucrofermentans DSM 15973]